MRNLNARKNGVGDPSSKYGYDRDGSQFDADIQANIEKYEKLWSEFVEWMQSKDVDLRIFRRMFTRYYEEFLQ